MKWITFCFSLYLLIGCSSKQQEKNDKLLKVMEEGLIVSNAKLDSDKSKFLRTIKGRLEDPASRDIMIHFQPSVLKADSLSNDMDRYFTSLKDSLKSGSFANISQKQSTEIYEKLKKYKEEMLWIDSSVANEFKCCFVITTSSFDSTNKSDDAFYKIFFAGNSIASSSAVLTRLQNNVKNRQNEIIEYFVKRTTPCSWSYDVYKMIVTQSSNYLKPNASFEVYAGIGAFTRNAIPDITVNGKYKAKATPEGDYMVSLTAPSKPGKYKTTVNIEFTGVDGKRMNMEKEIVYYVDSIPIIKQ